MFLLPVLAIALLKKTEQQSLYSGSIIGKKEVLAFKRNFLCGT
jgi:hypothetical protein